MANWFRDKRNGFLVYQTTDADVKKATAEFNTRFKNSNKLNSLTVYDKEESRIAGILGEIIFGLYAGKLGTRADNKPQDFIVNKKLVDVKCKFRTVIPNQNFEASDFLYQNNDYSKPIEYYAFLSTISDYKYVWFCGWATHDGWWNNPKGTLWKKGQIDETNHKVFHEDTWSVFYKDLGTFSANPLDIFK
jgi:hypothetical protein